MASFRIIFAGGGTGGHLFPAIAIADEIKNLCPDAKILFIGTKNKIEARIVPQKNYDFKPIWISGFHRGFRPNNLLFPLKVIVSFMQAYSIIKNFKADAVVGTGGYVSGPVLRAAAFLKVPTLIHEQNSYPGVTTRLLAAKVDEVHLTFESSKKYFSGVENIFITGNPTRSILENVERSKALQYFNFDPAEKCKTILVFGGSLGAQSINNAVEKHLESILTNSLRLIWQTGKEDFERIRNKVAKYSPNQIWVNAFIDRMDFAYSAGDLVVCRAGATTIAELTRLGKAAILVPYPHAAANHQVENARSLSENGAAEIIYDHDVEKKLFITIIKSLQDQRLRQISEKCKEFGKPNAANEITQRIIRLAKAHGRP